MAGLLNRATDWGRRAQHLRSTAERMVSPSAQSNLLDMAAALEQQAASIERTLRKLSCAQGEASIAETFPDAGLAGRAVRRRRSSSR